MDLTVKDKQIILTLDQVRVRPFVIICQKDGTDIKRWN